MFYQFTYLYKLQMHYSKKNSISQVRLTLLKKYRSKILTKVKANAIRPRHYSSKVAKDKISSFAKCDRFIPRKIFSVTVICNKKKLSFFRYTYIH